MASVRTADHEHHREDIRANDRTRMSCMNCSSHRDRAQPRGADRVGEGSSLQPSGGSLHPHSACFLSWTNIAGMSHAAAPSAQVISWRWIAVFWFAGAVFEATQSVFILHALGKRGGELLLFATELVGWLPWALATPFVIGLARRHPFVPAPTVRGIVAHLTALLAITVIAETWSAGIQMLFNPWT